MVKPRARTLFAVAALALAALTSLPSRSLGQQPLPCKIDKAHARVWAQINQAGTVLYYGHALMDTSGCQEFSPGDITVTFRPVAGSTAACDPRGTFQRDDAVCTTGVGTAAVGTTMLITATGKSAGTGGAAAFASACALVVPAYDNVSCAFPTV